MIKIKNTPFECVFGVFSTNNYPLTRSIFIILQKAPKNYFFLAKKSLINASALAIAGWPAIP